MIAAIGLTVTACGGDSPDNAEESNAASTPDISVSDAELANNPFIADWSTPFGMPPFRRHSGRTL